MCNKLLEEYTIQNVKFFPTFAATGAEVRGPQLTTLYRTNKPFEHALVSRENFGHLQGNVAKLFKSSQMFPVCGFKVKNAATLHVYFSIRIIAPNQTHVGIQHHLLAWPL